MKFIFENIKKSKFLVDFLSTFGANISTLLIGVLSSIIMVRFLGAEGMGEYTILTSFSLLFVSLAELGIRQSNIYFIAKDVSMLNRVISSNLFIWMVSSLIGISAFLSILYFKDLQYSYHIIALACLIIPITIANKFINGVMVGTDKIAKNSKFNFYNGLVRLGSVILFIMLLNLNVLGALIVLIVPTFTNLRRKILFLKTSNKIKLDLKVDVKLIKKLVGHGFLYGFALFLMTNQKTIPVYVMSGIISENEVGLYGVGLTFAGLVYQIFSAVAPIIFVKSAKSKDPHTASLNIQKLMRVMFVMLICVSAVIAMVIKYLLLIMYGEEFIASSDITRIMLVGIIFYNIFLVLNMDMAGKGKPWLAIYTLIPISIISLILNYMFIREIGIIGAAISTSFAMALASLLYLYFYSREVNVPILQIITPKKSDWNFVNEMLNKKK